nr:MAG TPA: hypothetical protein [Caudoviricetes sp.]
MVEIGNNIKRNEDNNRIYCRLKFFHTSVNA